MLSPGAPTTTTLSLSALNMTWGGLIKATPVVLPDAPGGIPLPGYCTLEVVYNGASTPYEQYEQADGTTFVVTDLPEGPYTLEAIFTSGDPSDYGNSASSPSTIYVAPAELTVTANDYSRAYGVPTRPRPHGRTASPGLSTATFSSSPSCS